MSQLTAYTELYPFITAELPAVEQANMLTALQRIGRQFCIDTEAFRDWLDPIPVEEYRQDYTVVSPYTGSAVHRVNAVLVNKMRYSWPEWEYLYERIMRFSSQSAPNNLEDQLLKCGVCVKTAYTDWTPITDGSVTFEIDDATYEATALTFAACTDMDAVAAVIQAGLRVAADNNQGVVRWSLANNRFFFSIDEGGSVGYLTAGTTGTDISGALYMNGLTGGTGVVLAPMIEVEAVFRPQYSSEVLPDWFFDRWGEVLTAGAIWQLAEQRAMPWSNGEIAARFRTLYHDGVAGAKCEKEKKLTGRALDFAV